MDFWFIKPGIRQGIFWALLLNCTSALNDILMRFLGSKFHFIEIAFFRFFFSTVTVCIPMGLYKPDLFRSNIHKRHIIRGILGAIALGLCCCSVNLMPLAENTAILFSDTFFTLILASIFLNEKPRIQAWTAIIIGLIGVIIMYRPHKENINLIAMVPTIASLIFAVMNLMIKRMVDIKEHTLTMLFYFGLYTSIISGIFVPFYWVAPSFNEIILLFLLGIGANLIQVFVFLAFRASSVSNISSLRYTELLFTILFGFVFFKQIPEMTAIIGGILIIFGTFISSLRKI
ncbi:MAG: DMT family transporter [Holosporales bacterium]|jgi:S-adenosylmethionine uptake transporter|nr:DMT family transporter [Holosporales bacterium]